LGASGNFGERILRPQLDVHCAGPFQGQEYSAVQATLADWLHDVDR